MDLLKGRNSKAEMNGIPDPVFIKQTYMVSDKGMKRVDFSLVGWLKS